MDSKTDIFTLKKISNPLGNCFTAPNHHQNQKMTISVLIYQYRSTKRHEKSDPGKEKLSIKEKLVLRFLRKFVFYSTYKRRLKIRKKLLCQRRIRLPSMDFDILKSISLKV